MKRVLLIRNHKKVPSFCSSNDTRYLNNKDVSNIDSIMDAHVDLRPNPNKTQSGSFNSNRILRPTRKGMGRKDEKSDHVAVDMMMHQKTVTTIAHIEPIPDVKPPLPKVTHPSCELPSFVLPPSMVSPGLKDHSVDFKSGFNPINGVLFGDCIKYPLAAKARHFYKMDKSKSTYERIAIESPSMIIVRHDYNKHITITSSHCFSSFTKDPLLKKADVVLKRLDRAKGEPVATLRSVKGLKSLVGKEGSIPKLRLTRKGDSVWEATSLKKNSMLCTDLNNNAVVEEKPVLLQGSQIIKSTRHSGLGHVTSTSPLRVKVKSETVQVVPPVLENTQVPEVGADDIMTAGRIVTRSRTRDNPDLAKLVLRRANQDMSLPFHVPPFTNKTCSGTPRHRMNLVDNSTHPRSRSFSVSDTLQNPPPLSRRRTLSDSTSSLVSHTASHQPRHSGRDYEPGSVKTKQAPSCTVTLVPKVILNPVKMVQDNGSSSRGVQSRSQSRKQVSRRKRSFSDSSSAASSSVDSGFGRKRTHSESETSSNYKSSFESNGNKIFKGQGAVPCLMMRLRSRTPLLTPPPPPAADDDPYMFVEE